LRRKPPSQNPHFAYLSNNKQAANFHSFCPCHYYPTPKMVTDSFGNKSFMHPMRRLSMPFGGDQFFSLRRGEGAIFGFFPCSQCVLNLLFSGSQRVPQVPKLFLQTFPIAPQFHLLWFAQSSTPTYVN